MKVLNLNVENGSVKNYSYTYTIEPEGKVKEIGEILSEPTFEEIVFEDSQKEIIKLILNKIKKGNRVNLLFAGTQGTGKTSSAKMIAVETGKPFVYLNGNESKRKIVEILMSSKDNSIVLIDEIHTLRENVAEVIYPAIQDNEVYFEGKKKDLNLMFIATTTEPERLPKPLLDRFKRIEFEELSEEKMRELLTKTIKQKLVDYILNYTHNFRVIKQIIETIKLYGEVNETNLVKVFRLKKINLYSGLSDLQEKYLSLLKKSDKPLGLRLLCLHLRKSEDFLKLEVESDLIRKEMILITSRGREMNPEFKELGYEELEKQRDKITSFTEVERSSAVRYLEEHPDIKERLGSRYLEVVSFLAKKIKEGFTPDEIDLKSFSCDCSIDESFENNYLEDL